VALVQGDIARLPINLLPEPVSAALIDVDLAVPVEAALERLWPRLSPGGILLVDDCPPVCDWKARVAAERFFRRHRLEPSWRCDMGVIARPLNSVTPPTESAS
jgi:predicted O-methyltransferase YrrM